MQCRAFNMSTRRSGLWAVVVLSIGMLLAAGGYSPYPASAQTDGTTTWDFETGDMGTWLPTGQVSIVTDSIDPLTDGAMHTVAQGQYSLKVGDEVPWGQVGDQFSSIEQTLVVPQADNRPVLQFSYAVVANDPPSHAEVDKPYFQLQVRDLTTGEDLPVSDFKYTSQTSQEWFLGQPPAGQDQSQMWFGQLSGDRWVFIPWKHERVELADRIGHQLLIKFTMRDCNPTAHAAYGYLDNIRIGAEVVPPVLPALENNPQPAGNPPDPNFIQTGAGFAEQYGLWPWGCCMIPLLLMGVLGGAFYKFWPRKVTPASSATEESGPTLQPLGREDRDDTGKGEVTKD